MWICLESQTLSSESCPVKWVQQKQKTLAEGWPRREHLYQSIKQLLGLDLARKAVRHSFSKLNLVEDWPNSAIRQKGSACLQASQTWVTSASGQHFLSLILYLYLWIPSTDHTGCSYELVLEFKLCSHILFWKHCIYLGQKWRHVFCILILNFYSMTFVALWRLSPYDVCRLMKFVASWGLSHYDVFCNMMFVTLWCLSHYDVCCIMTFVGLLRLLHYDVSRIMTFVAL